MWNVRQGAGRRFQAFLVITEEWKWYDLLFFLPLQIISKGSCCHPFTSTVSKLLTLWTQDVGFRLADPKQWCASSNLLFIYLKASASENQACTAFWQSGLITVMLLWQVLLKRSYQYCSACRMMLIDNCTRLCQHITSTLCRLGICNLKCSNQFLAQIGSLKQFSDNNQTSDPWLSQVLSCWLDTLRLTSLNTLLLHHPEGSTTQHLLSHFWILIWSKSQFEWVCLILNSLINKF